MQTTETKGKHTEGPWLAAASPSSVVGWPVVQPATGRVICTLNYIQHTEIDPVVPGDRAFNAESRANARLIASAPELLEALKSLVALHGDFAPGKPFEFPPDHPISTARAAILKAEGR